ncbi:MULTISPECIES: hypothetical protein [Bacillota]|uniref:hypothetical protein n=1 Tax=Bacillota TaxID=1239 RepID=UPI0039F02C9D
MRDKYDKTDKKVRFGRYNIKVTTYYLWKHKAGLRIEVRRFTWTQTVEIELLTGDDIVTLKRVHRRKALKNGTKKEVDKVVEEFIQYAKDNGFKVYEIGDDS